MSQQQRILQAAMRYAAMGWKMVPLYGVQAGVSGGGDYITLSGTTCGSPMDAVAYGAVAFDCASYRVIWMCCE